MIYLDNAATTKMDEQVLNAMLPYLKNQYGNPGALYPLGLDARKAIEQAREQVADLINCEPGQIVFTSGGSEANNLVIKNSIYGLGKSKVVSLNSEHDSVRGAVTSLRQAGSFLPSIEAVYTYLNMSSEVGLVSVMYINNETGLINPVEDIALDCHATGTLFHTDCVQALGSIPVDVEEISCDFASFSSHKIHGPKGVGALYVKDDSLLRPLICGGAEQEFGLRGGTENVAGIVGFGAACRITKERLFSDMVYIEALRDVFLDALYESLNELQAPPEWMRVNNPWLDDCTSKILNIRFDGVDAQSLVLLAGTRGVCISAGSACRAHDNKPSPALMSIGLTEEQARSSVRVSFSRDNTKEEVEEAARIIVSCALELGSM